MAGKFRRYELSPLAETDLEDIWVFTVENWSPKQAEVYHTGIVDAFEGLASGQNVGRRVDIREGYFKYAVGSHFIYYRQNDHAIIIIRILHRKMDVSRHI
jgi:toxin ParE1/3/4